MTKTRKKKYSDFTDNSYDEYGYLIETKESSSTSENPSFWQRYEYSRNDKGFIVSKKSINNLTQTLFLTIKYSYDDSDRLIEELEEYYYGGKTKKTYTYEKDFKDYSSVLEQRLDTGESDFKNYSKETRLFDNEKRLVEQSNSGYEGDEEKVDILEKYEYDNLNRVTKYDLYDYRTPEFAEYKEHKYAYYKETKYHLSESIRSYQDGKLIEITHKDYSYDHGRVTKYVESSQNPGEEAVEDIVVSYEYEGEVIHHYGEANYVWNEDYTQCTALAKCEECGHIISETSIAKKEGNKMVAKFNNSIFSTQEYLIPQPEPEPEPITPTEGLSGGAIAGIVIGSVAGVSLICFFLYFVIHKRR